MWKMCSTPSLFYYHLNLSSFQCRQFHTMVINGGRKGRGVLWWTHADGIWSTLCAGNDNPLQHVTAWILGANDGWTWQLCSFWMRQFPNNWIGMIQTMWFKAHVVIGQENGLPLKKKQTREMKKRKNPTSCWKPRLTAENEIATAWFVPNKVVTSYQESHLPQEAHGPSQRSSGVMGAAGYRDNAS